MPPKSRNEWIIISISGVTCGGKTTLANQLYERLSPVYIFNQDQYFYPDDSPKHVKCEGLEHNNYDILSALDMKQMYEDVLCTMNGDNKAHKWRTDAKEGDFRINNKKFLIVEGFTVLNYKPLAELSDKRFYLVLSLGECALRRSMRLYTPADVAGYFDQVVWPQHLVYRQEVEKDPRVMFLEGSDYTALDHVMNHIRNIK